MTPSEPLSVTQSKQSAWPLRKRTAHTREKRNQEQIPGDVCRIMLCLFLPIGWLRRLFQQPTFPESHGDVG